MFDGYASVTITGRMLKMIVRDYSDLLSEPSRFEGLLKDIYGSENKKEIFLLTTALRARITEIRECNIFDNGTENKIYDMITRLSSDYGLDDKSAAWVTIAWSIGFDLMTEWDYDNLANGNRAERYLMLGNYIANIDEGIQQVETSQCNPISNLIIVNATNLKQLYENGIMLHNQGKFAEALECYDKALAMDPHDEFIIKRRNNTREILLNSSSSTRSGQIIGQVTNLNNGSKKSMNLYFLVIAIAAVFLTTGIIAYIIFETDSYLEVNPLGNNSQLIGDVSTNHIDPINEGSESPSINSYNESISDFTNNIEKELNLQVNSENQSLLQNVTTSRLYSNSGDSHSNGIDLDSSNGVNEKVDDFKTELGKAMKSNFR